MPYLTSVLSPKPCAAARTPFTRAKKGGFKDTCPEDLLVAVFKAVVERSGVPYDLVEEIQVGNVLPAGGGASVARMAQLAGPSESHAAFSCLGPILTLFAAHSRA